MAIEVVLSVSQQNQQLFAHLTFTNTGDKPVDLVDFVTIPRGSIDNNYFSIKTQKDQKLSYHGMMKKRAAPGPEDFYWLEPKQSVQSGNICLNDVYHIPKEGELQIKYRSNNHFASHEQELVSNTVTIVLQKQ